MTETTKSEFVENHWLKTDEKTRIDSTELKRVMEESLFSSGKEVNEKFYRNDNDIEDNESKKGIRKRLRRTRFEVLEAVLHLVIIGKPRPIDLRDNLKLTAAVTQSYIDFAIKNGLIVEASGYYEITPKGVEVEQKISELLEMINMESFNSDVR